MKYFYAVHLQANEKNEVNFHIMSELTEVTESDIKQFINELTAEKIKQCPAYTEFAKRGKFKRIMADYVVYQTESDLSQIESALLKGDYTVFEQALKSLVDNKYASRITSGELDVTAKAAVKSKKKGTQKNKKKSLLSYLVYAGIGVACLAIGIGIGLLLLSQPTETGDNPAVQLDLETDGLIMPDSFQSQFAPDAELITISIDRSYSPIPREDIQIKGEIIDKVAKITLPSFDRSEFFSHVPGYTWGFTTDPNGKKIEYRGGGTYEFTENVKLYRVLVKYGGGNGTKDDPYLIDYYDQLSLMAEEKVGNTGSRGVYFRQIADIEFPSWANNTPIDTVNELKDAPELESLEYDGGGYMIEGLNAPLFGTVSGSVIKNVNISNSAIKTTDYTNIGFIVSQAFNYRYEVDGKVYETGETLIKNSSVSNSSINIMISTTDEDGNPLPKDMPPVPEEQPTEPTEDGGEENETETIPLKSGEFAIGGISGLGGQIENCYVANMEIFAELDEYFLYVGGISGKPTNVINSGVNSLTIEGNIFHIGGIAGSAGGSRLYNADGEGLPHYYGGNIQGCFVRGFTGVAENSAGGIAGEGSTNAENTLISNSYATGLDFNVGLFADLQRSSVIRAGHTGGIIGADGQENNGHLIVNTVSDSHYSIIGFAGNSAVDDTVRVAPAYAFYQAGILDALNRNTVHPNAPAVIFTGSFIFAEDNRNSDEGGSYAFPAEIEGLFEKTVIEENGVEHYE